MAVGIPFSRQRSARRGPGDESRPRPDLPIGADLLPQIGHIVVLMMENHSYDNYFGMLGKGDGLPLGPDGRPTAVNVGADGHAVRAWHLDTTRQVKNVPTQGWYASHLQYGDGRNDGFVRSAEEAVDGGAAHSALTMGYWAGEDIPFYYWLANSFPVVDRWFSSCLGPTIPNRRFLIAGTAYGLVDDRAIELLGYPQAGTIFDQLDRAGARWANYHAAPRSRVWVAQFVGGSLRTAARSVLTALKGHWGVKLKSSKPEPASSMFQFTVDSFPVAWLRFFRHVKPLKSFERDAAAGRLPPFCIVDPDFDMNSEENPQDIKYGEAFAKRVIDAVMNGPTWRDTVLVWLYDEHGGYYDHVPPPAAVPPDDIEGRGMADNALVRWALGNTSFFKKMELEDRGQPRRYDRYGFRVPAIIVSPYANKEWVCPPDVVFDHTSVLALLQQKWNLPSLTRRDLWARTGEGGGPATAGLRPGSILDALSFPPS